MSSHDKLIDSTCCQWYVYMFEVMSRLLDKIKGIDKEAAGVLKKEGFHTDRDIRSLTREDLNELFPGQLKLRKSIYEQIQQRPADELIRELKGFIPQESLRAALTNNGVLVDYLMTLKDIRVQMHDILGFLEAHIRFLEETRPDEDHKGSSSKTAAKGSTADQYQREESPMETTPWPDQPQGGHTAAAGGPISPSRNSQRWRVIYNVVVSGQTFTADSQLMEKVKVHLPREVYLTAGTVDHSVTLLFCPISSRIDSDITAAMPDVKDDKPVILVLMHHVREAKNETSAMTWAPREKIVKHVNVYYHETVPGLLPGHQNDNAAREIAEKLLEFSEGLRPPALCETDQHDDAGSSRHHGSSSQSWWRSLSGSKK